MKKPTITLFLLFLFSFSGSSQNWAWLNPVSYDLDIQDFALSNDQIAILGQYCDDTQLNQEIIEGLVQQTNCSPATQNYPTYNSFIALLDPIDGSVQEIIQLEGVRASFLDFKGETLFLGGSFIDTVSLNNETYIAKGDVDQILINLKVDGSINWVKTIGSFEFDYISSVLLDELGNSYVGGSISGQVNVNNQSFFNGDLIGKIKPNGDYDWVVNSSSTFHTTRELMLDSEHNLLVGGIYSQYIDIGNFSVSSSDAIFHGYLFKLDPQGNPLWLNKIEAGYGDFFGKIEIDSSDHVYVAGSSIGTTLFGDSLHQSMDKQLGFLARFRPDGSVDKIWKDELENSFYVDFKIGAQNTFTVVNEVLIEPFYLEQNIDVYLCQLDSNFNLIAQGLPYKVQDFFDNLSSLTQLHLGQNEEVFLSRRYYNIGAFNNTLSQETYYNSFIGKIQDFEFITNTELPPSGPFSTQENLLAQEISVYPNPTKGLIFIDFDAKTGEQLSLKVLNGQGQLMASMDHYSKGNSIDMNNYPTGIYFIQVEKEGEFAVKKVVKQ